MTATPTPRPFAVAYRPAGAGGRVWHVVAMTGALRGRTIGRPTTDRAAAEAMAADLNARSFELVAVRRA
jgi:hypothetical protein